MRRRGEAKGTRTEVFEELATATILTTVFIRWARALPTCGRWFIRFTPPSNATAAASYGQLSSYRLLFIRNPQTRNQGRRRHGRCFLPVSLPPSPPPSPLPPPIYSPLSLSLFRSSLLIRASFHCTSTLSFRADPALTDWQSFTSDLIRGLPCCWRYLVLAAVDNCLVFNTDFLIDC